MGIFGTDAGTATDLLLVGEVVISLLVLLGVLAIKRGRHVSRHRRLMLSTLALNAVFLAAFLVQDLEKGSNVVERSSAPPALFWSLLSVHLTIALSALAVALVSWRIAARGMIRTADGVDLPPDVLRRHTRVSRWYPWLWGATLATGFLLYGVVYLLG